MFSMFGSLKAIAIAAAISFVIGGVIGWRIEKKFCDAAYYKAQVETLQKQIKATNAALDSDREQFAHDQQQIDALKRKAQDVQKSIGSGKCLTPDDTDRLRDLWN